MNTPKTRKSQGESTDLKKSSGKKMVQARLPFKILPTPPTRTAVVDAIESAEKESKELRKRRLSYDKDEDDPVKTPQPSKRRSVKKTANSSTKKKQKIQDVSVVVELADSNDEDSSNIKVSGFKENLKKSDNVNQKQKKRNIGEDEDVCKDVIELVESSEDEVQSSTNPQKNTTPTPVSNKKTKITTPVAGKHATTTPQSGNKRLSKGRKSNGDATTDTNKVQIKLPISNKKNKRRKTVLQAAEANEEPELSDDVEIIAEELHPQKRPKLDDDDERTTSIKQKTACSIVSKDNQEQNDKEKVSALGEEHEKKVKDNKHKEQVARNSPKSHKTLLTVKSITPAIIEKKQATTENKQVITKEKEAASDKKHTITEKQATTEKKQFITEKNAVTIEKKPTSTEKKQAIVQKEPDSEEEQTSESDLNKSKSRNDSNTTTDMEDNVDTETTSEMKKSETKQAIAEQTADEKLATPKVTNESSGGQKLKKNSLTPKQQRLIEQRLKSREEKELKIQEERLQKQREKEDRELAKKREREEKEEKRRLEREEREEQRRKEREEKEDQRRKEREEKDEQRRKEREEKERKRLAENEAKNEEKRSKEEERKRKEQEKEEAELKKKKAALAFTKFFSRPAQDAAGQSAKENGKSLESDETLAFRPFQIKGDMKLAPVVRKNLTDGERARLEEIVDTEKETSLSELYLEQLERGVVKPCKWITAPVSDNIESKPAENDDDVIIVEDELERVGQAIVEEHKEPVERLRSKLYKFHENRRPPYFGTWRKKSTLVTARRPFAQDKKFFDYEVNSDDEWEEEEPGESLDGSDDDKEKESEDDDYEVDNEWFVPHGHLSDEELQNEDDLGENNDREAQKAKLQILQQEFAQEMKKKTEKIKPRLIGCVWVDENGNQPELCPKIIWDTLRMRTILCAEPPIMEDVEAVPDKNGDGNVSNGQGGEKSNGENKLKPIVLTEAMLKKLIRLVHGNTHSKNFLTNEFIAYIEANEESIKNGEKRGPLKSVVKEKIQEYAKWEVVARNTTVDDNTSNNNNQRKKKTKKKLCWIVSNQTLEKMDMQSIDLNNNWEYLLKPRAEVGTPSSKVDIRNLTLINSDDSNEHSEVNIEPSGTVSPTTTRITTKQNANIKKFAKVLTPAEKAQQLQKQAEQMKTPVTKTGTSTSSATRTPSTSIAKPAKQGNTTPVAKKRVPLLMSVGRGQTISTPDKNARISQFLKSINEEKSKDRQNNNTKSTKPMEVIETVVIE